MGGRYKASLIDSERYLLTCYRYIELNPVRAAMAGHPGDYPWSSYHSHAQGKTDPLIADHPQYLALGTTAQQRQYAYRELFRHHIEDEALHSIREALNQCRVLGTDHFKDEIEQQLKRRVRPGKPGRPRKRSDDKMDQYKCQSDPD